MMPVDARSGRNKPICKTLLLALLMADTACRPAERPDRGEVAELLLPAGSLDKDAVPDMWKKVLQPEPLEFPRDHFAHPDYQIEWWYYTGNVQTKTGRRIGYQLTFFRFGVLADPPNPSRWTVRDLYIAHFALSDAEQQKFHRFERTNRAGIDWAGADQQSQRVWNGDWQLTITGDEHRLQAQQDDYAIDLRLISGKAPSLHGERGMSRKGTQPGNASHYYSLTRLETTGHVMLDGERLEVTGRSWMDHEFSSSFLEPGQSGWDWFALQLDNGYDLMIYQIRRRDGDQDSSSSGTLVSPGGDVLPFDHTAFRLTPLELWKSPATGAAYPVQWRFEMPSRGLDLVVRAVFAGQEMDTRSSTGIIYWEGCVDVRGRDANGTVTGHGYLEMTGYASDLGGLFETP